MHTYDIICAQMIKFIIDNKENIAGKKRENAGNKYFLFFFTFFTIKLSPFFFNVLNTQLYAKTT